MNSLYFSKSLLVAGLEGGRPDRRLIQIKVSWVWVIAVWMESSGKIGEM